MKRVPRWASQKLTLVVNLGRCYKSSPWRLDNAWEVLTSVSSCRILVLSLICVHDVFRHFRRKSLVMILWTDADEMPVWRAICRWVVWVFCAISWFRTDHQLCQFYRQHRRPLPGADRLLAVPLSSILRISFFKPPNDNCLSGNIDVKSFYSTLVFGGQRRCF